MCLLITWSAIEIPFVVAFVFPDPPQAIVALDILADVAFLLDVVAGFVTG